MRKEKHKIDLRHAPRYILAGTLLLTPALLTWLVFEFLFHTLFHLGEPGASAFYTVMYRVSPGFAEWLLTPWVEYLVAVALTLVVLYFLGWATTQVLGRRLLVWFEALLDRVPWVKTIYGGIKIFLVAFQTKPEGLERVVLIDFPSAEMKTIGLVTRTMIDKASGEELAVVYVPTSPNPTSGFIQIMSLTKVISTDWTLDEAMQFLLTAGTRAPDTITFSNHKGRLSAHRHTNSRSATTP
ncbi:MAG: hypothetical protein USCGTAYLOR_01418 [Chromatiales bacterium USCg_Taylor]|nr:MAG: hypothetical protein USCGTAYLOR_01418 [Chromatiales bacterium USCg_Taylor]